MRGVKQVVKIHQRGVQWKEGVVICTMSCTSLFYNTTPIHCTPLPLHPPVMNTHSGISRMRFSPSYKSDCDSSVNIRFKKICVFASSNLGRLTVLFELYPWNPLGILRPLGAGDAGQPHPQGGDHATQTT